MSVTGRKNNNKKRTVQSTVIKTYNFTSPYLPFQALLPISVIKRVKEYCQTFLGGGKTDLFLIKCYIFAPAYSDSS